MQRTQPNANSQIIHDTSGNVITVAHDLKPVDAPIEALLGVANGAITGAMVTGGLSALVTAGKESSRNLLHNTMHNIVNGHLAAVACGTAAIAAISGIVRYSRAKTHNQWREEHYEFLRQQNHTDQVAASRETANAAPAR